MSTFALSKGVFAFKRSKRSQVKQKKIKYAKKLPESEELKNFHNCWSKFSCNIEDILNETHTKVFEDLVEYVEKSGQEKVQKLFNNTASNDISIACLVTGVNMPDHCSLFNNLSTIIKKRVTPYIARLPTNDCLSIKTAIFKIISSAMDKEELMYESDEENELYWNSNSQVDKNTKIKRNYNLSTLSSWYQDNVSNKKANGSSKKRRTPNKNERQFVASDDCENIGQEISPIIVIVEEVELVPIKVLEDLLIICSDYQKNIPFVFVFGVSTTPSYIHRHLSQEASSLLTMEVFQAQPSSFLLSEVIDKTLMGNNLIFGIGGKVFKLLLDTFLFHDLSVNNFINILKFCMLEHFLHGDSSFLCCLMEGEDFVKQNIPPSTLQVLRNLPSFKEFLQKNPTLEFKDNSSFCEFLHTSLKQLKEWHVTFCVFVRFLHCIVKSLPGTPLGRQVREVLTTCLSENIVHTEDFENCWKLLSLCAREDIVERINDSVKLLEEYKDKNSEVCEIYEKMIDFNKKIKAGENEVKPNSSVTVELKPSDRFNLREKLLGAQKTKEKAPFEDLKNDLLTYLRQILLKFLRPYFEKPFHEVFFFDSIESVKYQILGLVRATVTTGLANPQKYLQCTCCSLETPKSLPANLSDLSLCYKLHLECGKFINVYDWLQAFIAVNEEHEPSTKKKKLDMDEPLQARFIQSVCELQFLGFIKQTKRKTDHVQRLTWGGN